METNKKTHEIRQVCEEKLPILDIEIDHNEYWVSTTSSTLKSFHNMNPMRQIPGRPSITTIEVTDNKKFIITKDADQQVSIFSILQADKKSFNGTVQEALQRYNTGKNTSAWFSANSRLGCLMLDFTSTDSSSAFDIGEDGQVLHAELLMRRLFYYLIVSEEERMKEKDGFTKPRFILPESSGYDEVTLVLNHLLNGGISDPVLLKQVKDVNGDTNPQFPMWLQKLIFKSRPK